jgi:hypothetical protein
MREGSPAGLPGNHAAGAPRDVGPRRGWRGVRGCVDTHVAGTPYAGRLGAAAVAEEAVHVPEGEIRPIDDVRSTAAYRLRVAANLLRQWWQETG